MNDSWPTSPLEDLTEPGCPITYGVVQPGREGNVRFVRGGDIVNGRILTEQLRTISEDISNQYQRTLLRGGELLMSLVGNPGQVALVPDSLRNSNIARQVGLIRLRESVDSRFVQYYLQSPAGQRAIGAYSLGSVQQVINLKELRLVPIPLPDVKTQRAIGQVLGALDDKIELNRRMSDTLEAMARALFQSWFVDFDPVHAKKAGRAPVGMDAETAALFPDRFEDSPLGPIPAGWKVGSLGAFLNVELGGDWGEDNQFEESIQVVTLRGVDLEHLRSQGSATAPRRWIKHASLAKRRLRGNDILIATSGAGPCGRALWVSPYLEPAFDLPVVYSNFCKRLSAKSSAYAAYFDRVLFGMHQTDEIWEYVNGTSIPNLEIHSLLSGKCTVVPPHSVLERFVNFLSPIYQRLYSTESRILTVIRDSLLPRLLSGELRVPEAEAIAEAAT